PPLSVLMSSCLRASLSSGLDSPLNGPSLGLSLMILALASGIVCSAARSTSSPFVLRTFRRSFLCLSLSFDPASSGRCDPSVAFYVLRLAVHCYSDSCLLFCSRQSRLLYSFMLFY